MVVINILFFFSEKTTPGILRVTHEENTQKKVNQSTCNVNQGMNTYVYIRNKIINYTTDNSDIFKATNFHGLRNIRISFYLINKQALT